MFKNTSDNSQFRLREKEAYSSEDARRWTFYASVLYQNRSEFDRYRQDRLCKVWAEIERNGELDYELPWLRDIFLPWLGPDMRSVLEERYNITTIIDPQDP